MPRRPPPALALLLLAAATACGGSEGRPRLVAAATHTLDDAGLLAVLDSAFRSAHPEVDLRLVVTGSGEALEIGRRRDADVLLTHAPEDELRFVAEGHGHERRPVMHNAFVVAGPAHDPAGVAGLTDAVEAFRRIRAAGAPFVSRGDDSGTYRREQSLWEALGVVPAWPGYVEAGVGMADALRVAAERHAYVLTDAATFEVVRDRAGLRALVQGDPRLVNPYSVTLVNGGAHPDGARTFADWLLGAEAERLIRDFGVDRQGRPLFIPGAPPPPHP